MKMMDDSRYVNGIFMTMLEEYDYFFNNVRLLARSAALCGAVAVNAHCQLVLRVADKSFVCSGGPTDYGYRSRWTAKNQIKLTSTIFCLRSAAGLCVSLRRVSVPRVGCSLP